MRTKCQIWSRVSGYLRPVNTWNEGKASEFANRKPFKIKEPDTGIKPATSAFLDFRKNSKHEVSTKLLYQCDALSTELIRQFPNIKPSTISTNAMLRQRSSRSETDVDEHF